MTFLGWLSDLLERLSDLQLGDEKVTLNDLDCSRDLQSTIAGDSFFKGSA